MSWIQWQNHRSTKNLFQALMAQIRSGQSCCLQQVYFGLPFFYFGSLKKRRGKCEEYSSLSLALKYKNWTAKPGKRQNYAWPLMQNISQESNSPDLGQDKWECKTHAEKGREDKYCKAWLVRGTSAGQGGTFQLFALNPSCSIGRGVCRRKLRRSVMFSGFLPATSPATLAATARGGNPSEELLCIPFQPSNMCWPSPLGSWGQGCVHNGNQSKRRDCNLISFQPLTRAVNAWERLLIKWDKRWSHLP